MELTPEAAICRGTVTRADRRENENRVFAVLPDDVESAMDVPTVAGACGLHESTARKALEGLRLAKLAATMGSGVKGNPIRWYALRSPSESQGADSFLLPIGL